MKYIAVAGPFPASHVGGEEGFDVGFAPELESSLTHLKGGKDDMNVNYIECSIQNRTTLTLLR